MSRPSRTTASRPPGRPCRRPATRRATARTTSTYTCRPPTVLVGAAASALVSSRPCCSVTTSDVPSAPVTSTSSTRESSPDQRTAVTVQPAGSSAGNVQACERSHATVWWEASADPSSPGQGLLSTSRSAAGSAVVACPSSPRSTPGCTVGTTSGRSPSTNSIAATAPRPAIEPAAIRTDERRWPTSPRSDPLPRQPREPRPPLATPYEASSSRDCRAGGAKGSPRERVRAAPRQGEQPRGEVRGRRTSSAEASARRAARDAASSAEHSGQTATCARAFSVSATESCPSTSALIRDPRWVIRGPSAGASAESEAPAGRGARATRAAGRVRGGSGSARCPA